MLGMRDPGSVIPAHSAPGSILTLDDDPRRSPSRIANQQAKSEVRAGAGTEDGS
jgi:hypothetical protein